MQQCNVAVGDVRTFFRCYPDCLAQASQRWLGLLSPVAEPRVTSATDACRIVRIREMSRDAATLDIETAVARPRYARGTPSR